MANFVVVIEVIKNSAKTNLTYSFTKQYNLTGRVLSCEGFTLQGKNLDEHVVGGRLTACMDVELGEALMSATEEVYADRAAADDMNPIVAIQFTASKMSAASGGFILTSIEDVEVIESHEGEQDVNMFIALAGAIKEDTQRASAEALERAAIVKKQKRVELTSEAVQDQGLFAKAKNFLNSPVGGTKKVEEVAKPVAKPIIKRK